MVKIRVGLESSLRAVISEDNVQRHLLLNKVGFYRPSSTCFYVYLTIYPRTTFAITYTTQQEVPLTTGFPCNYHHVIDPTSIFV